MPSTTISGYLASFDEIHMGTVRYTEAILATPDMSAEKKKDEVCDFILDYLIYAYVMGVDASGEFLGYTLKPDSALMRKAIGRKIEGKTFRDRVKDHMDEESPAKMAVLAESEFHRIFNSAMMDAAKAYEKATGRTVYKKWCTVGDERVRDTHDPLDGVKVKLGERFYTIDDDSALQPGGFEKAENNAGCRCWLEISASEKT